MISNDDFQMLATAYEEVVAQPHFEKPSFRVRKRIFSTLDTKNRLACLKLSESDQSIYGTINPEIIYPVPNKWGQQGWTYVDLKKVNKRLLKAMLTTAYCTVAPKSLAGRYSQLS